MIFSLKKGAKAWQARGTPSSRTWRRVAALLRLLGSRVVLAIAVNKSRAMSSTKRKASEISPPEIGGWSVGPSDNFSDWAIEVVEKESRKETSYQVHRKDLACGANKSKYFARVFHSKGLKESNSRVTRVELESKVAKAFPVMLNFLYTGTVGDLKTRDIVPLFWLADYFMVESLQAPLKNVRDDKMSSGVRASSSFTSMLFLLISERRSMPLRDT